MESVRTVYDGKYCPIGEFCFLYHTMLNYTWSLPNGGNISTNIAKNRIVVCTISNNCVAKKEYLYKGQKKNKSNVFL